MKIKIIDKTLNHKPVFKTSGSVGLDLCSRKNYIIEPKQMMLISLNAVVECPLGTFAGLLPRSSLFKKKGVILVNSLGVIDQDYKGENDEIKAQLFNMSDKPVEILKGEDIMQLVFFRVAKPNIEIVEKMNENSRGGFGSTDKD